MMMPRMPLSIIQSSFTVWIEIIGVDELDPNADLHLLASLPNGSVKATIPRNPRIELVFDQAVSIQENHFILLQNGEKTDYVYCERC